MAANQLLCFLNARLGSKRAQIVYGMACRLSILVILANVLSAATLQRLSLEEMADKSTAIVRARIGACSPAFQGPTIYTTCQLSVIERWKGTAAGSLAVSIPGGSARGVRQTFSGAPEVPSGEERILFLWTGRSGLVQVIGLSQGIMTVEKMSDGTEIAVRAPVRDRMLDGAGRPVWDEGVEMPLHQLRRTVMARVGK